MKHRITYCLGLILSAMLFSCTAVFGQFTGSYDVANWTIVQVNSGNGSVNTVNAPASIALTGPDGLLSQAYTRYQITVPATGTISFDWAVVHQDPDYDGFGYWLNNTYSQLTQVSGSGSTTVAVTEGDEFAFYGDAFDGCCGTFVATISNFSGPEKAMNDAGIEQILSPSGNICSDSVEVMVQVKNYGANQISPVTVNWSVNGTTQTSVQYSGVLDTTGGSGADTANISLGNYFFLDSIDLKVWTSDPNNVTDTSNVNDTLLLEFVAPDPEITLNDTSFCEGEFLIYEAADGFTTYAWSTGSNSQLIQITQPGTYSITVTDEVGCQDSASAVISEIPGPAVNLGSDTSVCDSVLLNPQVVGVSYQWSTGATTQSIYATQSNFYSVTVESAEGCLGEDQVQITVNPSPEVDLGPNLTLCFQTGQSAVVAAGSGFSSYEWSTGETTSNIIVGGYGNSEGTEEVSVIVTTEAGCTGADTILVNYVSCWPTGVRTIGPAQMAIFPNPAVDRVQVELSTSTSGTIEILDIQGKMVLQKAFNGTMTVLDVSELASGPYVLRFNSDGLVDTQRLMID